MGNDLFGLPGASPATTRDQLLALGKMFFEEFGSSRRVGGGERLCRQGEIPSRLTLIESGLVKESVVNADGTETIARLFARGQLIEARAAIDGLESSVTAVTLNECRLWSVATADLARRFADDPALLRFLLRVVDLDRSLLLSEVVSHKARPALDYLLGFLSRIVRYAAEERTETVPVPLAKWEIGQLIGVCPEQVSRLVRLLKADGVLIEEKRNALRVDVEKLRAVQSR